MIVPLLKKEGVFLRAVFWYPWSTGTEFTYVFSNGPYVTLKADKAGDLPYISVHDHLTQDGLWAEKGFPLKGKGYIDGFYFRNGKTFADLLLTSRYMTHLQIEVGENGEYCGGGIIFPPTPMYETLEKRERVLLKDYRHLASGVSGNE